jgi:hypothetical protein
MKKPSEEARRRYTEYIKDYKAAIDAAQVKEKVIAGLIAEGGPSAGTHRLALADGNLTLVANYLLMSSLSLAFLGVKNEAFMNEARKCLYKAIIALEEIVSPAVDAPFADYEAGLATIDTFSEENRYRLLCRIGFSLDSLQEGFGENSKWKWSFVELEGRFAAVTKNLLNLKTLIAGMDPRSEGYSARLAHLGLARELLQQAADRYREKYELSTQRVDDIKAGINFLIALRRLHVVLGEVDQAEVVKKKAEIWRLKMENDLRKAEENAKK